jgi:hypothetical protein
MAIINTGAHPKALWPGVHRFFGQIYDEYPKEYTEIFTIEKSNQAYEEDVASSGFAFAQRKPEGGSFTYDSHNQEYVVRYTHDTWGLGYVVTMEELQDNLYQSRSFKRARMLAFSMNQTKEFNGSNILNNGFSSNYPGGDGQPLGSLTHPSASGSQANMLSTTADLSEAALEDTCIAISQIKTSRGLIFHALPELLIVHPNDMFNAERILHSPLQNDTANNAINALKSKGTLRKGYIVNHFLTSPTAWFVKTNVPEGLTMYERHELTFEQDNDFTTSNALAKSWERYKFGWSDWRGLWLNPGF